MRIIVIGGGQIGSALAIGLKGHKLKHWTAPMEQLSLAELEQFRPDAVICAAGKTDLAWCEANPLLAFQSNVEAPFELYRRITRYNADGEYQARYLHFSSGCVWDGPYDSEGKPFKPSSPVSPASFYAWTKAAADAMLLQHDPKSIAILRPRQVYSGIVSPRNTIAKLVRYPGLVDTHQSMSSMSIIVRSTEFLLQEENWQGIWNIYDAGIITPLEVGEMLADAGLRDRPNKLEKSELDQFHRPRRVDTVLFDARFERALSPGAVRDEMRKAIQQYAENLALQT